MDLNVTENECRVAINQIHGLDSAKLLEVLRVEVRRAGGRSWSGHVRVFAVRGHPAAKRCFVWPQAVDDTTTVIHAVLDKAPIATPEQAVRSRLR
jgi:hypothetical protein